MDKKAVRDLREKELKAMMMSRMGDFNGAMALMLDCFADLDDAIHFFALRELVHFSIWHPVRSWIAGRPPSASANGWIATRSCAPRCIAIRAI